MNDIYLVEDHDEALKIWRKNKIRRMDLVHVDAHIDFGRYQAQPLDKIINDTKSVKDLKFGFEQTLNFPHYKKELNKQAHIGNYIYPAIEEGLVGDFYWVIPGSSREFRYLAKHIKIMLSEILGRSLKSVSIDKKNCRVLSRYASSNFIICNLSSLPILNSSVLLDIDTDFLVIDSITRAENIKNIARRLPWIMPLDLVDILKFKIKSPRIITIAYSINGGWTPLKYRYFGDELAMRFSGKRFKRGLKAAKKAAKYFAKFRAYRKKEDYWRAARLNPIYRASDNNYGPLYLESKKFSQARKEFLMVLRVDPKNPPALLGMGLVLLGRSKYKSAKKYFLASLSSINSAKLFFKIKSRILLGLAKTEFNLKNYKTAKNLFFKHQKKEPFEGQSYFYLGRIHEKENDYPGAALYYKSCMRLDISDIAPLLRLTKIAAYLNDKDGIISYIQDRLVDFRKKIRMSVKSKNKQGFKKIINSRIKQKIDIIENQLAEILN